MSCHYHVLTHTSFFLAGMKKWITSNYHYMVPEFDKSTTIEPDFQFYLNAVERGLKKLSKNCAVPVVMGPVSMAYLTKFVDVTSESLEASRHDLVLKLIPVYHSLVNKLAALGVTEIQIHEPALIFEDASLLPLFKLVYPAILSGIAVDINIVSYMDGVSEDTYRWLIGVQEFSILSLDFTRGDNLSLLRGIGFPKTKTLGAGLIDSRSVWRIIPSVTGPILSELSGLVQKLRVQPSGSLQYVPWDISCETEIIKHSAGPVLAFAAQKLDELAMLGKYFENGPEIEAAQQAWSKYFDVITSNKDVLKRTEALSMTDFRRGESYEARRSKQLSGVVLLPTTTIGSFPQTSAIRRLRAQWKMGRMTVAEYNAAMDQQIAYAIGIQEAIGLDILVHGEAERTDMVEFFGEQMDGMVCSKHGWVQSFGSRCVRPPIVWSDISRPAPMTVREFKVAQNLTDKPVKGMLTGPVTILNWSFPRADIPRKDQCMQIAMAIRDEIADLEEAGCKVVQVDEPALREAMPIRLAEKEHYLDWAVNAFRLATGGARSETQVHTHMCYCEFNDCMEAIDNLDTDVNSIENARSDNATLMAFKRIGYTKGLGPGTYDIHSPVCPTVEFVSDKIKSFLQCVEVGSLVVNPDCGLKTRTWPETIASLQNMVLATKNVRAELGIVDPIAK